MKSKWVRQVMIMVLGSSLLVVLLFWFSQQVDNRGQVHIVFAGEQQPTVLNNDNLVEELTYLQLPVRIAKVDLERNILSVDLKVTEEKFDTAELYEAMASLISFSMEHTSNVDQLLLRLIAQDKWVGNRYLLLAADVRRGQWPATALEQLRSLDHQEIPEELSTYFGITETKLWKYKFQNY